MIEEINNRTYEGGPGYMFKISISDEASPTPGEARGTPAPRDYIVVEETNNRSVPWECS